LRYHDTPLLKGISKDCFILALLPKKAEMKLKITTQAICRTPAFGMNMKLQQIWPALKQMIRESSLDFYALIETLNWEDIIHQDEKVQFTIWKYFNRARYRPTPFGSFAAISSLPHVENCTSLPIMIKQKMHVHQWQDWSNAHEIHLSSKQLLKQANYFFVNSTLYLCKQEYRYISQQDGQFELAAIPNFDEVSALLACCKKKTTKSSIIEEMRKTTLLTEREILSLLEQLIQLQVIMTDLQANITGSDYLKRLDKPQINNKTYQISEREITKGNLPQYLLEDVSALLSFINKVAPAVKNRSLEAFKTNFSKYYEQKEIPLGIALDPQLGLGYGEFAQSHSTMELVDVLQAQQPEQEALKTIMYNEWYEFMLNKLIQQIPIHLEEYEFKKTNTNHPMPNTLSVSLHLHGQQAVIHHAAGATANALLGRFSLIKSFETYGKQIAQHESIANPDVIFFDVAYQCEKKVDNVNRRQTLYSHELAIDSWSTLTDPLLLEDIMVSVHHDEIVLRSKKHNKRLVPRIASAYNYQRSDLSLFRFLSDLQYQKISANLTLNLEDIFPGLDHYPRVNFKNCIVCPEKWLMPAITEMTKLKEWFLVKKINFPISVGISDQTLIVNPNDPQDLNFLLHYAQQQGQRRFYLTEALLPQATTVADEYGNSYNAHFIVDFCHGQTVYHNYASRDNHQTSKQRDLKLPGSEWVYLEWHAHASSTDALLAKEIKQLLKINDCYIDQWFFIRYNDPDHHIRLRLKLKQASFISQILIHINRFLSIGNYDDNIRTVMIKSYDREIQRYGEETMPLVEHFFYLDSKAIIKDVGKLSNEQHYNQVYDFAHHLASILYPDVKERLAYFKRLAENFANEFNFGSSAFKVINKHYEQKNTWNKSFNHTRKEPMIAIFKNIIQQCDQSHHLNMLADLIHMHINRRFSENQRLHEAIIYQHLFKLAQMELRLSTNEQVAPKTPKINPPAVHV
jgi:lantibiotic biosynthesis protein